MWFPCNAADPKTLYAAKELSRSKWDYLYEKGEPVETKQQYVKHFSAEDARPEVTGDRYVLSTGKIFAPAWNVSSQGLRVTSDAGGFALIQGPKDSDFIAPPKVLNAYRVRLDGPGLVPTVEWGVTLYFSDMEEEIGSQKFLQLGIDRDFHIRLWKKWTALLGRFDLELTPDATGGAIDLKWNPGTMAAAKSLEPKVQRKSRRRRRMMIRRRHRRRIEGHESASVETPGLFCASASGIVRVGCGGFCAAVFCDWEAHDREKFGGGGGVLAVEFECGDAGRFDDTAGDECAAGAGDFGGAREARRVCARGGFERGAGGDAGICEADCGVGGGAIVVVQASSLHHNRFTR